MASYMYHKLLHPLEWLRVTEMLVFEEKGLFSSLIMNLYSFSFAFSSPNQTVTKFNRHYSPYLHSNKTQWTLLSANSAYPGDCS